MTFIEIGFIFSIERRKDRPMDKSLIPVAVDVTTVEPTDKINNLVQKEKNLKVVGVTRRKVYQVIADSLDAVIEKKELINGEYKITYTPDLDKQRWGAELAIKMFGDMIERKEIEHDIGDKTLEKFRSLSVQQLRDRAKAILEGSPVKRIAMPTAEEEEF